MKTLRRFVSLSIFVLLIPFPSSAHAQPSLQSLRKDIEALKAGQQSIQRDLQEIKTLLRAAPGGARAVPQNVVLNVNGAAFRGEKDAKLTLVEFTDFQ